MTVSWPPRWTTSPTSPSIRVTSPSRPRRSGSTAAVVPMARRPSRCSTPRSPPMHEGRDDEAHPLVVESLDASKALGDPEGTIYGLEALAALSTRRGAAEPAAHVLGAAEGLARRHGVTLTPFERDLHARTVAALTGALGEERLAAAWAAGAALDLAGAVAFALQA